MIIFLDENDVEYGALATIKATNAVNGERSLTGTIVSGDYVLSKIERGWRLRFDDEYYVVTYAKPIDEGKNVQVSFDAVHQFFWDFGKSSVYDQLSDGSHTFRAYLDFIFNGSGYKYDIETSLTVKAFEKQSFGYKNRLSLFNDIITSSGVEFQVNGKVVRILAKVGTDLSTVVRKNFNLNELGIEKNIGDFVTYQKGFGAYFDEEDHSKGRLIAEYISPLASVYGRLEADPLVDERYKQSESLLNALKETVDNSYTISVSLDMEDLTRAGYRYTQPVAGDYIMAINETLGFKEKIRIVSFTSEYDVAGQLIKHTVTCNDIGSVKKLSASYTQTQHQAANAEVNANTAYEFANKALVSANGKNTNYYGDTFPVDNPKGTLKKGDLLFLTVGDTVKQYYWNGAEWVTNPVVSDVEAFKEQIAEELKDVPNREEFENKIAEELATSKAEITTQIESAKTQAESNAKEYADTINQETAKVAELANAAAGEIKADLVNVKNNLTSTSLVANNAQASVDEAKQDLSEVANELNTAKQDLSEVANELNTAKQNLADSVSAVNTKVDNAKEELTQAKQQLTTVSDDLSKAKTDFQNAVSAVDTKATNLKSDLTQAKQDLASQAQQLQEQASAQSELTNRVSSVEETANGTKTTVSELSKTVAQNGKDITNVTARTKVVEDDLAGTKTTLSQVKTTADSTSQKTATLESGLDGLTARFDNLKIGGHNYLLGTSDQYRTLTSDNYLLGFTGNGNMNFIDLLKPLKGETVTIRSYIKNDTDIPVRIQIWFTGGGIYGNPVPAHEEGYSVATGKLSENFESCNIAFVQVGDGTGNGGTIQHKEDKLEKGSIATDYSPNEADLEQKVAEYKQTADQNYASLQTTVQNLDGTVQHNKTTAEQTAQGFSTRIESLETYKDGESTRANQYFESAKTETAKQLTAERTAIAKDYVAKSTYTSDVTGIRNDLSATTTTANTTKTNLANYQASNDRAVANLQSNLQTANGNISSLKTKVEAVPGQITSAVSSVESKIPTSAGGRNLALDTSADWTNGKTSFSGIDNETVVIYKIYNKGLKVGDKINARIVIKYSDIVAVEGQTARILSQAEGNVTSWGPGGLDLGRAIFPSGEDDEVVLTGVTTITENHLRNEYWDWRLRIDYVSSGRIQWKEAKAEVGDLPTPWSPAPEDTISQISNLSSEIKQTADGMTLLATKTELNTAKNELQSGITTATNKANAAQNTANSAQSTANSAQNKANSNAQTISTHTTQISALNTGLQAKVSQSDFDSLSGRVSTAENNIIAKANELSSKITSVEGKIPTTVGGRNYLRGTSDKYQTYTSTNYLLGYPSSDWDWNKLLDPLRGKTVTLRAYIKNDTDYPVRIQMWFTAGGVYCNTVAPHSEGWSVGTGKMSADWTSANVAFAQVGDNATGGTIQAKEAKLEIGNISSDWTPAPEDAQQDISNLSSELRQTADGMTLLATKTELNSAKSELQSGITTATNKANSAQSTANSNAQTISTHTTQISALNTGLNAKVSQSDFNMLSGRVTTAENNITAKANELSSKISSVEGKIPTSAGGRNLALGTSADWSNGWTSFNGQDNQACIIYRIYNRGFKIGDKVNIRLVLKYSDIVATEGQTAGVLPQTVGNRTHWGAGQLDAGGWFWFDKSAGEVEFKGTVAVDEYILKNEYWDWRLRADYIASGKIQWKEAKAEVGDLPTPWSPAPEDTISQISNLSSEIKQTADGMTLLATKTELNTAKNELQSGITTATNKANNAQSTANSNAQTISTHTTQISALNTGLQAKVSQYDFNTLSGRVTTAENNIIAKANELSSKITSVEGKIPTSSGGRNLAQGTSKDWSNPFTWFSGIENTTIDLYQVLTDGLSVGDTFKTRIVLKYTNIRPASGKTAEIWIQGSGNVTEWGSGAYPSGGSGRRSLSGSGETVFELTDKIIADHLRNDYWNWSFRTDWIASGSLQWKLAKVERGMFFTDWSPAPEDYDSKLATAQSEFKQTTDAIKASVSSLDKSTVKSSSLTINSDGVVIKAGKSTSDFANAVGSYFSVNQNAINLFSDKINVKGNMIVSGAITSDKIASKQINTAHLNGKIITADVISSNAVTADAIKAGAVTTDKMSANSINGDRIAAGTLDAAKIKAGSITASQIASGTITSNQIKAGGISSANIAAGAITGDKIAAGAIDANKIAANAITANMIRGGQLNSTNGATVFDLNAGTLTFNNNYGYIQRVASDKVFEITTYLSTSSGSQEHLTSAFNIRKSDNSRQSGVKFTLYNTVENKPTAEAKINADALILYDSINTRLFSVHGKSTFAGGVNFQGWGDIPIAKVHGGLVVNDIGIGSHTKSLLKIVEELCKKAGILWV